MQNVFISKDTVVASCLKQLRNRDLDIAKFREYADKISLPLIQSSIGGEGEFVIIAILRSAVAMLPAAMKLLPFAGVGFAGLARDEQTAVAREYYWKMPQIAGKIVLIPDPMLATGGSILHVLKKIKELAPKQIRIVSIISAPEGVLLIHKEFPDIKIFTAALDFGLDDKKFIVPGLGDFGDRYFGTTEGKDV